MRHKKKVSRRRLSCRKSAMTFMESLASFQEIYDGILAALAASHEQAVQVLRNELQQLKDAIPDLEKKSIKRLKLAGTLTAIENESQKAKVKAALRRKKDLNRIDDFLIGAFRTLRALNRRLLGHNRDSLRTAIAHFPRRLSASFPPSSLATPFTIRVMKVMMDSGFNIMLPKAKPIKPAAA